MPDDSRYPALDVLRGFGLFGVLMVNLLYFFRISLFGHMVQFHAHAGLLNHAIDIAVAAVLEFKAFALFSFTFGVGVAIQFERVQKRGAGAGIFLLRRFLILLGVGLIHMVFISNVDILCLYSICGLLLIPLLGLPHVWLWIVGIATIYVLSIGGPGLPAETVLASHAIKATEIYSQGTFGAILAFRWTETRELIWPLLIMVFPRTLGLMMLGVAAWKSGVVCTPRRYLGWLWTACILGSAIGGLNTLADLLKQTASAEIDVPQVIRKVGSSEPLAAAYAALLFATCSSDRVWLAPIAALGRMALSNYLMQSIIFAAIFYGFGFGYFGRLDSASTSLIGLGVYVCQAGFSVWWLKRYRFGPFEWLWRSGTYGYWQPMKRPLL